VNWLDNPAVQGGVAPLVVALVMAALLLPLARAGRSLPWLAVLAGYVTSTWLATGVAFTPLTASRRIFAAVVVLTLGGFAADLMRPRSPDSARLLVVVAMAAGVWCLLTVIGQRDVLPAALLGAGVAVYVGAQTALSMRVRHDGLLTGAIGVGLGVATGVAAVLSASVGFLLSGIAIAAGSGALLLVQVLGRRVVEPGCTGATVVGLACALFASGSMLLAQMPWFVLPLLLVVPAAAPLLDPARLCPMARASALVGIALALALIPVVAAWLAARYSVA
jgi:hypothetical protein